MTKHICDVKDNCHIEKCFHRFPHERRGDCCGFTCVNTKGAICNCIPVAEEKPKQIEAVSQQTVEVIQDSYESVGKILLDLIATLKENIALKDELIASMKDRLLTQEVRIENLELTCENYEKSLDIFRSRM